MKPDIIFIGAGLAALGAAWRLSQRGMKVLILEQDRVGAKASGAAGGMLAPSAELHYGQERLLELELESLSLWPSFADELERISRVDVDLRTEGTLMIALDQDDAAVLEHQHAHHKRCRLRVIPQSAEQLRQREPALTPLLHSGLYLPDDHQVDARLLIKALSRAVTLSGAQLREQARVEQVITQGGKVIGVMLQSQEIIYSDRIVLANGAWFASLGDILPKPRPHIRPVRGQMLKLELGAPALCRHVIRAPDAYLVPKSSGFLLVGSTMEEMGFDERLTAGGVMDILVGAWRVLPGIHEQPILEQWSGLRPVSLNNEPHVMESEISGLYLSIGHGRHGVVLTPWTAQRLSELILES